jgi:hypothetical protein
MRKLAAAVSVLAFSASAHAGQSIQGFLTSEDLSAELFGIDMQGVAGIEDTPWSECIEPGGKTVYTFMGLQRTGQMSVQPEGIACFRYEDDGVVSSDCFRVSRNGPDGYVFSGATVGGSLFRTTRITRNINTCPTGPAPVS